MAFNADFAFAHGRSGRPAALAAADATQCQRPAETTFKAAMGQDEATFGLDAGKGQSEAAAAL